MAFIRKLRWDEWNAIHIARHNVTPEEVEDMFAPKCPIHRTAMKKRKGQYGEFWSCGVKLQNGAWCRQTSSGGLSQYASKSEDM